MNFTNVDRGVDWLDENGPAEWWDRIDIESLSMSNPDHCVAGQVFAQEAAETGGGYRTGYDVAWDKLGGASGIVEHGFATKGSQAYAALRQEWVERIENRIAEVNA